MRPLERMLAWVIVGAVGLMTACTVADFVEELLVPYGFAAVAVHQ